MPQNILTVFLFSLLLLALPAGAHAQNPEALPDLPEPIQNLATEGAQMRFLGREGGVDGWVAIKNGQEQYFYILPGGKSFVMGVLFDDTGRLTTIDQVKRLQEQEGSNLGDLTADFPLINRDQTGERTEFKTPAEQMFYDIERSNWVALGNPSAPVIYSFIDPQCPHCHDFTKDIRADIESGKIQLRLIPVGFKDNTKAQAAFLMAAPDPQDRWFKHVDGDVEALPVREGINTQGAERNLAIMQSWELLATPMVIYRDAQGAIKLVRGRPANIKAVLADLGV